MNKIILDVTTEDEQKTFTFKGVLKKDVDYLLEYDDLSGNTVTNNSLHIGHDALIIHRSGALVSKMIFQENMLIPCDYEALSLKDSFEIYTEAYNIVDTEDMLEINLKYDLMSATERINRFKMRMVVYK